MTVIPETLTLDAVRKAMIMLGFDPDITSELNIDSRRVEVKYFNGDSKDGNFSATHIYEFHP